MSFHLTGIITEETASSLIKEIVSCQDERIVLYINSLGGDYEAARFLYGVLIEQKKEVVTAVIGDCWSSAVLVALAGDERWAIPTAKFVIHSVYDTGEDDEITELVGPNADTGIEEYQKLIEICHERIKSCQQYTEDYYRLIAEHTALTPSKIKNRVEKAKDKDWIFPAKEALKFELIDSIGLPEEKETPKPKPMRAVHGV